ncbi:protein Lines homolog 1 isoform X1, partial [Lates japonicus]
MESAVSCREPFTRTELFDCLTDTYRCFLTGSCPTRSPADVAGMIFTGVCELVPMELTCISVTLVDKMIHLMSKSPPPEVSVFCAELLRVLFQDMDLMSQLVHQFQTEDQIISHLAAKSVSTCAVYHLHKS